MLQHKGRHRRCNTNVVQFESELGKVKKNLYQFSIKKLKVRVTGYLNKYGKNWVIYLPRFV